MKDFTPFPNDLFNDDFFNNNGIVCKKMAYLDLTYLSCYKDCTRIVKGCKINLNKGECVASIGYLSKRWNWSVQTVRTFVNKLICKKLIKKTIKRNITVLEVFFISKRKQAINKVVNKVNDLKNKELSMSANKVNNNFNTNINNNIIGEEFNKNLKKEKEKEKEKEKNLALISENKKLKNENQKLLKKNFDLKENQKFNLNTEKIEVIPDFENIDLFDYLKNTNATKFENFEMNYKGHISDFKHFKTKLNNKIKLELSENKLTNIQSIFYRINSFASSWVQNQSKFSNQNNTKNNNDNRDYWNGVEINLQTEIASLRNEDSASSKIVLKEKEIQLKQVQNRRKHII